ncbi:unnamed protein product [Pipistrellus nathusii]|uniref:Uncharacterized protein n=1 Tax=Pipistrellus nathusii TaxID=59473 RepID=A0ABN9ZXQ3_PIPNA
MARRAPEATDPSSQLLCAFWGLFGAPHGEGSIVAASFSPTRHAFIRPSAGDAAGSTASCPPASSPAPPRPAPPLSSPPLARAHGEPAGPPPPAARGLPRTRQRTAARDPPVAPLCSGESGRGWGSQRATAAADAH